MDKVRLAIRTDLIEKLESKKNQHATWLLFEAQRLETFGYGIGNGYSPADICITVDKSQETLANVIENIRGIALRLLKVPDPLLEEYFDQIETGLWVKPIGNNEFKVVIKHKEN